MKTEAAGRTSWLGKPNHLKFCPVGNTGELMSFWVGEDPPNHGPKADEARPWYVKVRCSGRDLEQIEKTFQSVCDGTYEWDTPDKENAYLLYKEGPADQAFMEAQDRKYLKL